MSRRRVEEDEGVLSHVENEVGEILGLERCSINVLV